MDTSAVVMNSIPYSNIAPVVMTLVALAVGVFGVHVIRVELANRREAHLQDMNENPELAALSMPMPEIDNARTNERVDTGAILRQEGFGV